ncbi:MAG: hypothetical protein PVJ68_12575 [Candidatus Thiodiazotropha sp.]|jgi:hypothetical protein
MKSTLFKLSSPKFEVVDEKHQLFDEVYSIPTLPAYAVLNHNITRTSTVAAELDNIPDYELLENTLRVKHIIPGSQGESRVCLLTLIYADIRDYGLLFPHIDDHELKQRLGQFAEEADNAFQGGAWMSFTIMAISVVEALLFNIFGNKNLSVLIDMASSISIINEKEKGLLDDARKVRNRVHAGQFKKPLADRCFGTDLYVLYDQLLKKDWMKLNNSAVE